MPPARPGQVDDAARRQGKPVPGGVQGAHLGEEVGGGVGVAVEGAEGEGSGGGVRDRAGQDRVGGEFDERGVAVGDGSGDRPVETHGPPQVRGPVRGVEHTVTARVVQHGGVDGDAGEPAPDVRQLCRQLVEQRIHLGGVTRPGHPHRPRGPTLPLQPVHQSGHRLLLPGDHLLAGRGVHGDIHAREVPLQGVEFAVLKVHHGHRPAPQPAEQPGPYGDDAGRVRHLQRARAHRGRHLPREWPMTATGSTPCARHSSASAI